MNSRAATPGVLFLALLWSGWNQWENRPFHPPDGVVAPDEPQQSDTNTAATIRIGRWTLMPRAHYDITARILGKETYRVDPLADLIPEDLALGWGPMSDNQILAAFDISQGARFYSWRPRTVLPIPREDVIAHSANTHVIPRDSSVRARLARLRVGQVVHLTGTLVDATRNDGGILRTSLTRTDSGAGACEVMLVEAVEY